MVPPVEADAQMWIIRRHDFKTRLVRPELTNVTTRVSFALLFTTSAGAYQRRYRGIYTHKIAKPGLDLKIDAEYVDNNIQ